MRLRVGPACFRIASAWPQIIAAARDLYRDYPDSGEAVPDFTVRLEPSKPWRQRLRPSVHITGDYWLPDAAPLPLAHGLLAMEMGMNLQMALGWKRHLLLHASTVERDGKALIMTGLSGSGKSTLSVLLAERGWRYLGDEFALIDCVSGQAVPFPRPASLKNASIEAVANLVGDDRLGPLMTGTPKGDVRHCRPPANHIARMTEAAMPALLLFPRHGHAPAVRELGATEIFARLTQASTNYVALGEPGYAALTRFVRDVPARAIDFDDGEAAIAVIEDLWGELA